MSIVPHGETCVAFCFLSLLFMAAPSLRLRHRHPIIALHGHQLMQPVAFFAVIVVALAFLGYERLNFCNDLLALRKLLRCAQLVKLTLGSVVDDKIRFMRGIEFLLVFLLAYRTILLDNGIGLAVIVHRFQHCLFVRRPGSGSVVAAACFPCFRTGSIHGGAQLIRG